MGMNFNIAFYTVLLCAIQIEILLLPVHVHHVENTQILCRHFSKIICGKVFDVIAFCQRHVRLS